MTVRFEEIRRKATRRWTDPGGKRHQETRIFSQTINPFNVKDGRPKTRAEIEAELDAERKAWLAMEVP